MALTRESALFYWAAVYGLQPIVGGDPVFSRDSAATMRGSARIGRELIRGLPRFARGDMDGQEAVVLQLDMARTNYVAYSENFGAWNKGDAPNLESGKPDPFGGTDGWRVEDYSSTAVNFVWLAIAWSIDGEKAVSLWVRRGDTVAPSGALVQCFDGTAAVSRLRGAVGWDGDSPTVTMAAGTLLGVEQYLGDWWRLLFRTTAITAANSNDIQIHPAEAAADIGNLYIFGAQAEDGLFPTSYIRSAGSATLRSADQLYFTGTPDPQPLVIYTRHVEQEVRNIGAGGRVWEIGNGGLPRLLCYRQAPDSYRVHHETAGGVVTSTINLGAIAIGDTVELVSELSADGVKIYGSLNGAGVVNGGGSSPLALGGVWPADQLQVNSLGAEEIGRSQYSDVRIVTMVDLANSGEQGRLDEMRDFVLDPSGNRI